MNELGLYEIAYLCGGAERVAQVALVALCQDGRIQIAPARHRVMVVRRESGPPVEAAALEAVPEVGLLLRPALTAIAQSPAVREVGDSVRRMRLVSGSLRPQPAQGKRLRRRLMDDPGEGLRRVAVLGTPGIEDARLRRTFETPDPAATEKLTPHRRRGGGADPPSNRALSRPDDYDTGGSSGGGPD